MAPVDSSDLVVFAGLDCRQTSCELVSSQAPQSSQTIVLLTSSHNKQGKVRSKLKKKKIVESVHRREGGKKKVIIHSKLMRDSVQCLEAY